MDRALKKRKSGWTIFLLWMEQRLSLPPLHPRKGPYPTGFLIIFHHGLKSRGRCFACSRMVGLSGNISCYLYEARMKLSGVLYHVRRVYPLEISILFIQSNARFFFSS